MKNMSMRLFLFSFFSMLVSCATVDNPPQSPSVQSPTIQSPAVQSPTTYESYGRQVARHLKERYESTAENCEGPSRPSFLCNGVMVRGTASNPDFHVWENSPTSIAKGGVSVSYLRADSKFNKLAYGYNNGYFMTAYLFVKEKLHPEVLCFFPIDAATVNRADKGCGANSAFAGSGPCHLEGVTTAAQWWTRYNSHPNNRHNYQCGFDVRDDRNTLAGPAFAAGVKAMGLMGGESFQTQNEFRLATWGNGLGKQLPLEAFFYLEGSAGLLSAQHNQRDLKNTDGILIPIISLRLPATQGAAATFYYFDEDQTEALP